MPITEIKEMLEQALDIDVSEMTETEIKPTSDKEKIIAVIANKNGKVKYITVVKKPYISPFGPEVDYCGSYIYPEGHSVQD